MNPEPHNLKSSVTAAETIPDLLAVPLLAAADSPAVAAPGRAPMTYRRLASFLSETTDQLRRIGLDQCRRIAIVIPAGPEAVMASIAVMSCSIAAPLNPKLLRPEYESLLVSLKADCLLAPADSAAAAAAGACGVPLIPMSIDAGLAAGEFTIDPFPGLWPEQPFCAAQPEDVAVVMQTSGTTGDPKRVPLTHANLCAGTRFTLGSMGLTTADRMLAAYPSHLIAGLELPLVPLSCGASICCAPGFYGAQFLNWIEEFRPTGLFLAPPALRELVEVVRRRRGTFRDHSLRFIRSGSAPVPTSLLAEAEDVFGVPVIDVYGMTEASPIISCNPLPPAKRKPGSAGLPTGTEVMIADAEGGRAPARQVGEILIRGPNVMHGYEDSPEANRGAFANGWFRTGDLGWLDEDGYLFVTGRIREMINRGGEKIMPREVEEVLLAHPAVFEAVVFPIPHERLSEDVAAAVVLRPGASASESELRRFAGHRLTVSKVPARILLVSEIPKGPGGKPRRTELAARFDLRPAPALKPRAATFAAPSSPLEKLLAEIWSRILGVDRVGIHDSFFDLGGDSFSAAALLAEVQKEFSASAHLLEAIGFLDSPSIAHMAYVLEGGAASGPGHPWAVALEPRGSAPALFVVPGLGSNPLYLLPLASRLGAHRPFYALRDPRPLEERGFYTLEDMAENCLLAARVLQPRGPYLLVGHCLGGIVAFEMARKLVEAGERVALLAMFDTPTPGYPSFTRHWPLFVAEMGRQLKWLATGRHSMKSLTESMQSLGEHLRRQARAPKLERASEPPPDTIEAANLRMGRLYRPGPYSGRVVILSAEEHIQTGSPLDRRLGWREWAAGGIEVYVVPGEHFTTIAEPYVGHLADRLRTLIDQALTSAPPQTPPTAC